MKKIILFIFCLVFISPVLADESLLSSCNKTYSISADELYLLTLSTLNGTGQFEVLEMQTKSGYILFQAEQKKYMATISKIGTNSSNIKILPANSDFSNGTVVQQAIFSEITQNIADMPKQVL